jgi:hypothetical protein
MPAPTEAVAQTAPLIYLYLDDSGSRKPDRGITAKASPYDYFAIGSFMVDAENDEPLKACVTSFLVDWSIQGALHSTAIRNHRRNFAWLGEADRDRCVAFYSALSSLILSLPITIVGCVIDRNGYNLRYRDLYGDHRWRLCKTAFSITAERAARFAVNRGRRLKIICEMSGGAEDLTIRNYYRNLRTQGMPFSSEGSAKYHPMSVAELRAAIIDLEFKNKESRGLQIADLVLYPIARGGYDPEYRPFVN